MLPFSIFCFLTFMSSAPDGDYWRLLNPGEYKVVVWAEGYFPSMRRCHVGMEPHPTICDFTLTQTPIQRLKEIRAKGGKIPQDLHLRLRALRLRKLRASTKVINRRRESQREQQEQQLQARRARSSGARRAWEQDEGLKRPQRWVHFKLKTDLLEQRYVPVCGWW